MPKGPVPSHIQPLPIAFTASELPRSFVLAALRIIPCLSTTWAHAAKATASNRTAKLWMLTRALPTRANQRASSSRVEVTLRFHLQTPQRRCVATSLAGQLVRPMTYQSLPTFSATSDNHVTKRYSKCCPQRVDHTAPKLLWNCLPAIITTVAR